VEIFSARAAERKQVPSRFLTSISLVLQQPTYPIQILTLLSDLPPLTSPSIEPILISTNAMETVSIPTSVPAELKAADLILKRARELKTHDPVMAYWCEPSSASPRPRMRKDAYLHPSLIRRTAPFLLPATLC
jgi:hypothetical protein